MHKKKHDAGFPVNAIKYCLDEADSALTDLNSVVFYDRPLLKFERLLETYLAYAAIGFRSFVLTMSARLKELLGTPSSIRGLNA
ncbi:MAG: hypothetical protein JKX81_05905 [Arenicella sp.]|nr:hypothetical protein [Arenicella sp.]